MLLLCNKQGIFKTQLNSGTSLLYQNCSRYIFVLFQKSVICFNIPKIPQNSTEGSKVGQNYFCYSKLFQFIIWWWWLSNNKEPRISVYSWQFLDSIPSSTSLLDYNETAHIQTVIGQVLVNKSRTKLVWETQAEHMSFVLFDTWTITCMGYPLKVDTALFHCRLLWPLFSNAQSEIHLV